LKKYLANILIGAVLLLGGFLILVNFNSNNVEEIKAGSSDNVYVYGWAWSDNIGWISFNCYNDYNENAVMGDVMEDRCAGHDYGVNIDSVTGALSGYAWSDNIGWISFNQADLAGCPSGTCQAEVIMSGSNAGEVSGWAKAINSTNQNYGWIKLRDLTDGYAVDIDTTTGHFGGYGWGGGPDDEAIIGPVSFNCDTGGAGGADICTTQSNYYVWTDPGLFNQRPYIQNTSITPPTDEDFCDNSASYFLSWVFRDDDAPDAYENTYEIEITNTGTGASGTFSPGVYPPDTVVDGDIQSLGIHVMDSEDLSASPPQVTYSQTYAWQIRVQDDKGLWSHDIIPWEIGPGFTVPEEYPDCSFSFDPEKPHIGQEITFTDTSNPGSYAIVGWLWDFGDGTTCLPDCGSGTNQNPSHTYFEVAPRIITLTITDADGRTCSTSTTVNIRPGDPDYDEVIPR
jgi:hypothetical protein